MGQFDFENFEELYIFLVLMRHLIPQLDSASVQCMLGDLDFSGLTSSFPVGIGV